jgi:hypothetical protein
MVGVALLMMGAAASAPPLTPVWTVAVEDPHGALEVTRDPLLAGGRGGRFLLGCGLFRLDARGRPRGDLARKARSREGGVVWDIRLRGGLKLSDGSDLDAVGFVRLWNSQIPARREARWLIGVLAQAPTVLAVDTVRFRLTGPRPHFLYRLSHPWLALVDPAATVDDTSALGPFRRVPPTAGKAPAGVLLAARPGHFHGLELPGDLRLQHDAESSVGRRVCASGEKIYSLVFNGQDGLSRPVRRRLRAGLDRGRFASLLDPLPGSTEPAGRDVQDAPGPMVTVPLLLDHDDHLGLEVADRLQAGLLDTGLRLQIVPVSGAELERRLRAPLFTLALVSLPRTHSESVLATEALLAATGLHRSPWLDLLIPAMSRGSGRGSVPQVAAVKQELEDEDLLLEIGAADECHLLPSGADSRALLPWLTSTPVGRFKPATRELQP